MTSEISGCEAHSSMDHDCACYKRPPYIHFLELLGACMKGRPLNDV